MRPPPPGGVGALLGVGFLPVGAAAVVLGPLIPELEATWRVTHAQAASLFVAQFAASSLGAVLSSLRLRRSLVGGYAAIALGLAALAAGGWGTARAAMAVTGFGLGLVIAASNLYVAHAYPDRRGAALSTLNLLWGVGAVSCPLLFAAAGETLSAAGILALLAAAAALLSLLVARGVPAVESPPAAGSPGRATAGPGPGFLATTALMLFLYVGSENAVGGWLVALADEAADGSRLRSLLIGSGFWGALLAGRLAAPWLLRRLSEAALFAAALALAGGGALLLLLARSAEILAAGALITGLGMAPIFPLTVSLLAAATAATRSRRSGWVLACGGLGGAALPWLTGRLAGAAALGRGFLVPLAALAGLALLYALQRAHPAAGGGPRLL